MVRPVPMVTVTHELDPDGNTQLITVPLTNVDQSAVIFKEDFDFLLSLGVDPRWRLSANLVLVRGKHEPVSRLIVDARKGEKVRYKDGDPTNLRRSNLFKVSGAGKSDAQEKQKTNPSMRTEPVRINYRNIPPSWIDGLTQ
jgi:hypothetical protein